MNEHYIRLHILKKLLFSEGLRFTELRPFENIDNNLLGFHVMQLVKEELIVKDDELYKLTQKGKEFANRMDTDQVQMKKQGKIGAISCGFRKTGNEYEFLLYTRLKQPFFGSQGFPSGKVQFGEKPQETSKRELKEETNLDGEPKMFLIEHQLVYDKSTKELLEDKYFYFFKIEDPEGELKANEEGKFEWIKEKDISKYLVKPFESVDRILYFVSLIKNSIDDEKIVYNEVEHFTDNF